MLIDMSVRNTMMKCLVFKFIDGLMKSPSHLNCARITYTSSKQQPSPPGCGHKQPTDTDEERSSDSADEDSEIIYIFFKNPLELSHVVSVVIALVG